MSRFMLGMLLALCATAVQARSVVPLLIGDAQVQVSMDDGYVRGSEVAPAFFATSAAAMPPAVRLAELIISESDLKARLMGKELSHPYLLVQVMRDAEALRLSGAEWHAYLPKVAQQLAGYDVGAHSRALEQGMGERMSKAAGGTIAIRFGDAGKTNVYSTTGDVIRYLMRLPIKTTVEGKQTQTLVDCAGAVLVLNGKLIILNAYQASTGASDTPDALRGFLDAAVTETQALNPVAPVAAAAPVAASSS